jgi:c-di-GMP-binding flagellar brake protein YcgR
MNATSVTIDEFGRDISLRKQTNINKNQSTNKFKGMKWSDICDEIEEEIERMCLEQEQKQKAEDRIKFRKITEERKQLLQYGLYELEEGEVLE